jgi:hypothetical protein
MNDQLKHWDPWQFLIGEWVGEGGGAPGEGGGLLVFHFDLDNQVLVRRNEVQFLASDDKPASRHEDLTIIYPGDKETWRAVYFDNEGHVINYQVEITAGKNKIMFLSDPVENSPRFRLTYQKLIDDSLEIVFDMAFPGNLDNFIQYTKGIARRKSI